MNPSPSEPLRPRVERSSATLLVYLRRLPRFVVPVVVAAVAAGGVLAPPPVGGLLLLVVLVLIGWLGYLSWPVLDPVARGLRVGVGLLVLILAVVRL